MGGRQAPETRPELLLSPREDYVILVPGSDDSQGSEVDGRVATQ